MALTVAEVMNREVFSVPTDMPAPKVLEHLLTLGITAAPVVDEEGQIKGVVSLRDLIGTDEHHRARERMTWPAVTVEPESRIEQAARLMAHTCYHHLAVVGADGKVVGFVSVLDIVRGLLGMPASHPATFPHYDERTGVSWSDDTACDLEYADLAPTGEGVLALVHGAAGMPERVVWSEAARNVRQRLIEMLLTLREEATELGRWFREGQLRFRVAATPGMEAAERAAERLRIAPQAGSPLLS